MTNQNDFSLAYLDSAREFLSPRYQRLGDRQLAGFLHDTLESFDPMERDAFANLSLQYAGENFLRDIGKFASKALPYVAPVAQIAAPLVGTTLGGPIGGALGSALAGMLGGVAGPRTGPAAPPRPPAAGGAPPRPAPPTAGANPAAAQLMSLLANPQLIQALLGQVLGSAGRSGATIQTAGLTENIPFGALMGTLSELALRATEESVQGGDPESEAYLGDVVADPFNPADRADRVMELLREDHARRQAEAEQYDDAGEGYEESYDDVTKWLLDAGIIH